MRERCQKLVREWFPPGDKERWPTRSQLILLLEKLMGSEAKIITAYQAKVADLQSQLDTVKANAKDADDIAAEQAAEAALSLDANGDPVAAPAPAPAQ